MDNRPVIGITTQTLEAIPDQLPRCWVMSQRYVRMLVTVGAVPWVIPLLEGDDATLRGIYEQIDGLFLPGGARSHGVRIAAGSRLARLLETEALSVNSMHHQGIARLAPGLAAVATSPDGLIEGVEANDSPFVLGVQWHPEDLVEVDPRMRRLFEGFITAAAP